MPFFPADSSIIECFAIVLGFGGGTYAFLKLVQYFLGKPDVKVYIADTVDLVLGVDGPISSFHLGCAFENRGSKTGVVQYMEARVIDPQQKVEKFGWEIFVQYQKETDDEESSSLKRIPLSIRQAIPVRPNDTAFHLIQFSKPSNENTEFDWMVGTYSFEVRMWVNAKSLDNDPSTKKGFHATVGNNFIEYRDQEREKPVYFSLQVTRWD